MSKAMLALKENDSRKLLSGGRGANFRWRRNELSINSKVLVGSLVGNSNASSFMGSEAPWSVSLGKKERVVIKLRFTLCNGFRFMLDGGEDVNHGQCVLASDSADNVCVLEAQGRVSQELSSVESAGTLMLSQDYSKVLAIGLSSGHYQPNDLSEGHVTENRWLSRFVKAWVKQHGDDKAIKGAFLCNIGGEEVGELSADVIKALLGFSDESFEPVATENGFTVPHCFPAFVSVCEFYKGVSTLGRKRVYSDSTSSSSDDEQPASFLRRSKGVEGRQPVVRSPISSPAAPEALSPVLRGLSINEINARRRVPRGRRLCFFEKGGSAASSLRTPPPRTP